MVFADFLTETGRKWLQAFKLFKSKKNRKSTRNRVSPDRSFSGTVDARTEIDVHHCPCRTLESWHGEYRHSSSESGRESDSAYESDRGSPARVYTVTYFNVDSEDASSIHTEYTLLDEDAEEEQNLINESIELVSSL